MDSGSSPRGATALLSKPRSLSRAITPRLTGRHKIKNNNGLGETCLDGMAGKAPGRPELSGTCVETDRTAKNVRREHAWRRRPECSRFAPVVRMVSRRDLQRCRLQPSLLGLNARVVIVNYGGGGGNRSRGRGVFVSHWPAIRYGLSHCFTRTSSCLKSYHNLSRLRTFLFQNAPVLLPRERNTRPPQRASSPL